MRTWGFNVNKNSALWKCFSRNTADTRCMRNTANFYIRNVMTGLRKSPEERTHTETEVLHEVFTGIQKANTLAVERYRKNLRKLRLAGGMKSAVVCSCLKLKQFSYPTRTNWFLSYEVLDAVFKVTGHPVYCQMDSQVNQNAIRKTVKAWKSYFKAVRDYAAHPEKYQAKPRIPGYIRTMGATAWWTNQTAKLRFRDGKAYLRFVNEKQPFCLGKASLFEGFTYVKTEVQPFHGHFRVLVTFDDRLKEASVPEHPERILGVDIGITNLLSAAGNFGDAPFVVGGGPVKALNQWFNKRKAELLSALTRGSDSKHSHKESHALDALSRKRDDAMTDIFYKCAWYLLRYAKKNQVDVIVIGYNKAQKQDISIGKQNNQAFVSVPYGKLRQCIRTVATKLRVPVVEQEESYTSKASLLDLDEIPVYKKGQKTGAFSGSRIRRGLYRSADGTVLNADVNGAGNILRKRYPEAFDGMDLSYLWKTTKAVQIKDWYQKGEKKNGNRRHKASGASKAHHEQRKRVRREYLKLFGKSKKKRQPEAA